MSDKAPSSASSPNSFTSLDNDQNDDGRSRRIGDPAVVAASEAEKAERAEKAYSAAEVPRTEGAATDPDPSGRPVVAAAAVQSQLNHYARGLIMVQK